MGWYQVIKTVKGRRYRYWQTAWREGGRVRTYSRYVGPVDGGAGRSGAGSMASVITTGGESGEAAERQFVDKLMGDVLSPEELDRLRHDRSYFDPGYTVRETLSGDELVLPDPEVIHLGFRMGVCLQSQVIDDGGVCPVYMSDDHAIVMPSVDWYHDAYGVSRGRVYTCDLLHELVHSTMRTLRKVARTRLQYHREEISAELGANLVMFRLGIAQENLTRSAVYLQSYRAKLSKRDITRARREAERACDHILKHHSRFGWTPS